MGGPSTRQMCLWPLETISALCVRSFEDWVCIYSYENTKVTFFCDLTIICLCASVCMCVSMFMVCVVCPHLIKHLSRSQSH